jgi:hypothetical protein
MSQANSLAKQKRRSCRPTTVMAENTRNLLTADYKAKGTTFETKKRSVQIPPQNFGGKSQ